MKNNRLMNLLAKNARRGELRAEASSNTLYVYDVIVGSDDEAEWFGGISPRAFRAALAGMTGDVALRINSPGGDVFGARAMAEAMREYSGRITAHVDGYAASAASLLAVSADRVVMAEGSFVMIHNAWTFAMGNAADLQASAALLDKIDGTLAESYARRGARTAEEFAALMAAETWFSPAEAIEAGLADEMTPAPPKRENKNWNLSAYQRPPQTAASAADHHSDYRQRRAAVAMRMNAA
jgi:ATP-dependent Clp protease, protease subunit